MKIFPFLKFVYNGLLTGMPSLTYNPFTKNTFMTEFNIYHYSTYINYKLEKSQYLDVVNQCMALKQCNLSKGINSIESIFNLEKISIEDNEEKSYYLSLNIYNCSLPMIPSEEPITRFEINTYVKSNSSIGTLILDYTSNYISMDPVNIFKGKDEISFRKEPNESGGFSLISSQYNENFSLNFTFPLTESNNRLINNKFVISDDLLKYSDLIFYKNGVFDKLYYDSSLTNPSIEKVELDSSHSAELNEFINFRLFNITFDKPDNIFYFKNYLNMAGGMWKNIYEF